MTDPAANARTVQHIEPEETPMRIEVYDYAEPKRKPKQPLPLALLFLGLIAVLFTLMIAHLVVRSGIAEWM